MKVGLGNESVLNQNQIFQVRVNKSHFIFAQNRWALNEGVV